MKTRPYGLFVKRIYRRFLDESFDQISASLAYTTLLAIVPLVAVVFGVLSLLLPSFGILDDLDRFIVRTFLPQRDAGMIVDYVLQFSRQATHFTLIGLGALVVTVLLLMQAIERSFNRVWRVTQSRSYWRQFWLYIVLLILWPLATAGVLSVMSFALTNALGWLPEPLWMQGFFFKAIGFFIVVLFFTGLYFAVPNTHVALRHAFCAGFFAAAGFHFLQNGFELYLANFPSYTLIYGAFATLPIFLLWLYLSWAVILLGALIAAALPELE